MLSSVVAPVTAASLSVPVPVLLKVLPGPSPRSAMATRSVSRPPFGVVWAKCLRSNRPLFSMLLPPPVNCTKPVIVPKLLMTTGSPATARSESAPMLPKLFRVAVPPLEFRITPAAGRPKRPEPPVRPACQPPFTDPPGAMLTVAPSAPFATIPVLNCPVVVTFVAFTSTVPGVPVNTGVARNSLGKLLTKLVASAKMPIEPEPFVVIWPMDVTLMLPPPERAAMPMPFPPNVVMLPFPVRVTKIGASPKLNARIPIPLLRTLESGAAGPIIWIVDSTVALSA